MPNPTPRTIAELRAWYTAHNLPPEEVTRFFIGRDIREPKAFGIYQEGDRFIVYKNKADGSRAVRYQGPDEGYAVNELYLRLKQEIANQKQGNAGPELTSRDKAIGGLIVVAVIALVIGLIAWAIISEFSAPNRGYYYSDDSWYYYQDHSWYYYEDNTWGRCSTDPAFADHYGDYYVSREYSKDYDLQNFELTDYYSTTDTSSSWDSSDSWDSGSTDWSSDW